MSAPLYHQPPDGVRPLSASDVLASIIAGGFGAIGIAFSSFLATLIVMAFMGAGLVDSMVAQVLAEGWASWIGRLPSLVAQLDIDSQVGLVFLSGVLHHGLGYLLLINPIRMMLRLYYRVPARPVSGVGRRAAWIAMAVVFINPIAWFDGFEFWWDVSWEVFSLGPALYCLGYIWDILVDASHRGLAAPPLFGRLQSAR